MSKPRRRAATLSASNALLVGAAVAALAGCASTPAPPMQPFTTDGCSLFPDRSSALGKDWCLCCVEHDRVYWRGGPSDLRLKADEDLRACVRTVAEHPGLASLIHAGVRIGGSAYLPTPFRWGYGWAYGRFYQPLLPGETAIADRLEAEYRASVGFNMCPSAPPALPGPRQP